jgi:hypothetical protein
MDSISQQRRLRQLRSIIPAVAIHRDRVEGEGHKMEQYREPAKSFVDFQAGAFYSLVIQLSPPIHPTRDALDASATFTANSLFA